MGSNVAPSFANIYMASFEQKYVYEGEFTEDALTWVRYMDDVFLLWKGSTERLEEFV